MAQAFEPGWFHLHFIKMQQGALQQMGEQQMYALKHAFVMVGAPYPCFIQQKGKQDGHE